MAENIEFRAESADAELKAARSRLAAMNRGELQLALRAIQARKIREEARLAKEGRKLPSQKTQLPNVPKPPTRPPTTFALPATDAERPATTATVSSPHHPADNTSKPQTARSCATSAMDTARLMTLLEEEEDDKPRDVAKNGLTLRQLYQLRKEADAWHHVFKMKLDEAASRDRAKRIKAAHDKTAMSRFLDNQVATKKLVLKDEVAEKRYYAAIIKKSVDDYKTEQEKALVKKLEKNANYRAQFRSDIQRLRSVRVNERQRKIAAEKKDMLKAKQLADSEAMEIKKKKEDNFLRMKSLQEDVRMQMEEKKKMKEREEQEILRLEREWIKSMDQKDRDRHAAFDKIVAQQAAKEASFSMSTQAIINKQLEEDEKRAEKWRQEKWNNDERRETEKIERRKAATVEQIRALELEKRIQSERRKKDKETERTIALQLIKKDLADLACEHEKQRAIKRKQTEYRKLLEAQIAQHEKRKQAQIIGIVQPNEMALNMSLFKEAGFLSQDVKADPKPFKHKH